MNVVAMSSVISWALAPTWLPSSSHAARPSAASFYVLRSSGHVGSRWLAELLATQDLAFFFEFPGRCSQARYPAWANASIHDIFRSACACRLDSAMEQVACAADEHGRIKSMGCIKEAFCSGRCPARPAGFRCGGVGMIDSYQPALARRLAAARSSGGAIAVATFERDNAAKHAISKLRASCGGTALKGNHVKSSAADGAHGAGPSDSAHSAVPPPTPAAAATAPPPAAPPAAAPPPALSMMHIEPGLFFEEAFQSLLGRRRMRDGVEAELGAPQHTLHYEDLQVDAAAAIRALLRAVGAGGSFDEAALRRSGLRKGSSDDLRRSLLNFDELHASLRGVRCLQEMLAAPSPRRFEPSCLDAALAVRSADATDGAAAAGGGGGGGGTSGARGGGGDGTTTAAAKLAHQAKQDTSVRVLRCTSTESAQGATQAARGPAASHTTGTASAGVCTVQSMNRVAAEAVAALSRTAGLKAKRRKRRDGTLEQLPPPRRANASLSAVDERLAALLGGGCTEEEERLCATALSRAKDAAAASATAAAAGDGRGSGTLEAELCLLRAPDAPLLISS